MNVLLLFLGTLCVSSGAVVLCISFTRLFIHIDLVREPNYGTGLLMTTVGLIAIRLARRS